MTPSARPTALSADGRRAGPVPARAHEVPLPGAAREVAGVVVPQLSFRVDRMTGVAARTWRFSPRPAPDAATYVQEGVASRVYRHRARLLVHAPAETVRTQVPASAAVVRPRGSDRCEVLSGAAGLDFVLVHVLLLGHDFEVLDPPELATRCRVLAERLLSAAATAPPVPDVQE